MRRDYQWKIEISKDKQRFRANLPDGWTKFMPLSKENVEDVTRKYTQHRLAEHLLGLEQHVERAINTHIHDVILHSMGFRRDTWKGLEVNRVNGNRSLAGDLIKAEAEKHLKILMADVNFDTIMTDKLKAEVIKAYRHEAKDRLRYKMGGDLARQLDRFAEATMASVLEDSILTDDQKAERYATKAAELEEQEARRMLEELKARFGED